MLLDHNVTKQLAAKHTGYEARTAAQMGWDRLTDGELIAVAEAAAFEASITADQNLGYQRNLAARALAVIVLSTNRRKAIEDSIRIIAVIAEAVPGSLADVTCLERPFGGLPTP